LGGPARAEWMKVFIIIIFLFFYIFIFFYFFKINYFNTSCSQQLQPTSYS
jgi:hypothetical protein